jgi:hypothetical protein
VLAGLKPKQTVAIAIVKPGGSTPTVNVAIGQYPGTSS